MSSIPSRLHLSEPALDSILRQDRKPDQIVLSLPTYSTREGCGYQIPEHVERLAARGVLTVHRTQVDYGPGTKLLGSLPHLRTDDIVVIMDDDNWYEPFVLGDLCAAIHDAADAASFYVYENRGLRIGQGADGFAMMGAAAFRCGDIIPIMESHPTIRMHDDVWVSFMLQRQGVCVKDLSSLLSQRNVHRAYTSIHSVNGLFEQEGNLKPTRRIRNVVAVLYRHGRPTPRMHLRRTMGLAHGLRRRISRMSLGNPLGKPM